MQLYMCYAFISVNFLMKVNCHFNLNLISWTKVLFWISDAFEHAFHNNHRNFQPCTANCTRHRWQTEPNIFFLLILIEINVFIFDTIDVSTLFFDINVQLFLTLLFKRLKSSIVNRRNKCVDIVLSFQKIFDHRMNRLCFIICTFIKHHSVLSYI